MKKSHLLLLVCLLPNIAFASEGNVSFFWYWFNFLVFITILFFSTKKPLKKIWLDRIALLDEQVNSGKRQLESAENELKITQAKLASADSEIESIKSGIKREGELESTRVIDEANKSVELLRKQFAQLAEAENANMEEQLQKDLVEHVISQARLKIQSEFNTELESKYRTAAVSRVKDLV